MSFDLPKASSLPEISHQRYILIQAIGRGGMGEVVQVRDRQLQRELAMKVLSRSHSADSAFVDRFIEEAQIAAQLQHPGIVPIHDIGKLDDGRPFFTMKLVRGQTLESLLEQRQRLDDTQDKLLSIFSGVCQAVAYAHSKGVIHRDLKPSNIMVDRFGEVQVMDWGLAKILPYVDVAEPKVSPPQVLDSAKQSTGTNAGDGSDPTSLSTMLPPSHTVVRSIRYSPSDQSQGSTLESLAWLTDAGSLTSQGYIVGTMAFMPPEQARGCVDELDCRCDVFALGAILCVILTGKPPYCAATTAEQHCMASQGDLVACHERLRSSPYDIQMIQLAVACLSPEPQDRPKDGAQVAQQITEYLANVGERLRQAELERAAADARLEAVIEAGRLERQRQKWARAAAIAIGACLIVGIASSAWILQQRSDLQLALSNQRLAALEREQERNSRIEQSRLNLEQLAAPMQLLLEQLWEMEYAPTHGQLRQIQKYFNQTQSAYHSADSVVQQQWDLEVWQARVERLRHLAKLCSHLPQPLSREWLCENLFFDPSQPDPSRQLALSLKSLPRWAAEELTVAIASAAFLEDAIPVEWTNEILHSDFEKNLWSTIKQGDLRTLQDLASQGSFESLALATQLLATDILIHQGSQQIAERSIKELEWIPLYPLHAVNENNRNVPVSEEGWLEAHQVPGFQFRVTFDVPPIPINVFRLETYCGPPIEIDSPDSESDTSDSEPETDSEGDKLKSVKALATAPTVELNPKPSRVGPGLSGEGPERCMVREIKLRRLHPDFPPEPLHFQRFFSEHTTIPGLEVDNAFNDDQNKLWALGHADGVMFASTLFETRPVTATRFFPQLQWEINSSDLRFWQAALIGRFRLYYAKQPNLPAEDHLLIAEQILERLNRKYPTNIRLLGLQALARISSGVVEKRNREAAIVLASTAASIDPYDKSALMTFTDLTLSLHPEVDDHWYRQLIKHIEAIPDSPATTEAIQKIAAYQRDRGDRMFAVLPTAAREAYIEAERFAPESFHRHGRLAFELGRDGRLDEAIDIARKGVSGDTCEWEDLYYYGFLALRSNDEVEAWNVFQRWMQDPKFQSDSRLRLLHGRLALIAGATEEGRDILRNLDGEVGEDPEVILAAAIGFAEEPHRHWLPWLLDFWQRNDTQELAESSSFIISRARRYAWGTLAQAAVHAGYGEQLGETLKQHLLLHPDLLDETTVSMDQLLLARLPPRAEFINLANSRKLIDVYRAVQPDEPRWIVRSAVLRWLAGETDQAISTLESLPFDSSGNGDSILRLSGERTWQAMARVCLATMRLMEPIQGEDEREIEIEAAQKCLGRVPEGDRDLAEWLWWEIRLTSND
jgi:serine/threonine protein kinase